VAGEEIEMHGHLGSFDDDLNACFRDVFEIVLEVVH
jgi:small nuclear ribonucleoprotein (snRNP)-like protein